MFLCWGQTQMEGNGVKIMMSLFVLALLSGCSQTLSVSSTSENGIPINHSELHVVSGELKFSTTHGDNCTHVPIKKLMRLPTDTRYYVNVTSGLFSKSEFTVELDDLGNLKQAGLTSEPDLSQAIEMVSQVGGLFGLTTSAAQPSGSQPSIPDMSLGGGIAPEEATTVLCDAGEDWNYLGAEPWSQQ